MAILIWSSKQPLGLFVSKNQCLNFGREKVKSKDVKIGSTYMAKVTKAVVPVKIDQESPRGGWWATRVIV